MAVKHVHEWSILPEWVGNLMRYIAKCGKCGEVAPLKPEIVELVFKNGGVNEDR